MSGKDRQEGFEQSREGASGQGTPEALRFDQVMKGQGDRQPKTGDASATRAGDIAYLNSEGFQKDLAEARQHLSPDVRNSIAAAVSVPAELKAKGVQDPVEHANQTAAKQQEHIDNYAKALASKPHEEQIAEAVKLSKYMDKMSKILNQINA